ncbi:MAG: DHHA1 domain-containing protein [Betaproteobacteria bacterium]
MTHYDVCNGDADGLFALRQLRLANPVESIVVTGIKRDIALLGRVPAVAGDHVTVLDIALERNREALDRLLAAGVGIAWYDHHAPGPIPAHPRLAAHIDTDPETCTSILVDARCHGRFRAWAVAAAYGDNLPLAAERLADTLALAPPARAELRLLGEAVNYNAYGDSEADVRIHPAALYRWLVRYADPFEAMADASIVRELDALRRDDLAHARAVAPLCVDKDCMAVVLPDAAWSRRVLGPFANELALRDPARAHAVLKALPDGGYAVSVRAPCATPRGAGELAREFGGGGRAAAAGIDRLAEGNLPRFIARLAAHRWAD